MSLWTSESMQESSQIVDCIPLHTQFLRYCLLSIHRDLFTHSARTARIPMAWDDHTLRSNQTWRWTKSPQGQPSPQQETHYPPVIKHGWEIPGRNEGLMGKSSVYIKGGFSIAMFSYWKVHLANIPSNTDCSCLCTSSPSFNSDTVGDSGCWVCSFS